MAKILVAEDDKLLSASLCDALKAQGHEPLPAYDGEIAVAKAKEWQPELILLDIMMPTLNGWETCKILREDKQTQNIPIVIMSALPSMGDSEKAFEAGANDFIKKPFGMDELMLKIRKWLN